MCDLDVVRQVYDSLRPYYPVGGGAPAAALHAGFEVLAVPKVVGAGAQQHAELLLRRELHGHLAGPDAAAWRPTRCTRACGRARAAMPSPASAALELFVAATPFAGAPRDRALRRAQRSRSHSK